MAQLAGLFILQMLVVLIPFFRRIIKIILDVLHKKRL